MEQKKIGIVGGGLMGMALARKLAMDGHTVTVLERDEQLGGLATWHDFGGFYWDRFYHVILPSDRHLITFIRDLNLGEELEWERTFTGFFVDECMHSISSNLEFLRFPLLSMFSKARLAWTILYASRIDDWRRLEGITVEDWLVKMSGQDTYDKLWKPLLLAKLGQAYHRVSAVFIWSYLKRLFSARDKSASAEHLGHVGGGYRRIFTRLRQDVENKGGNVRTATTVTNIEGLPSGGIKVTVDDRPIEYDAVICTSPVSVLRRIVSPELIMVEDAGEVEYLGVVCVVVVSKTPLVPFYVVNIADENIPFTGIIGTTNVINSNNTAGMHLTYLPKYMLSSDEELSKNDDYFRDRFLAGLRRMLPDLDPDSIVSVHVNRAAKVQPLQVLHYSKRVPKIETRHPRLYVLNTSQFVNATLNNNEVILAVNHFCDQHAADLAA